MIPDDVEKIIMTKEDYDRNVEQLLYDKINAEQEVERLNNIINELEKWLEEQRDYYYENYYYSDFNAYGSKCDDVLDKIKELKGSESNE